MLILLMVTSFRLLTFNVIAPEVGLKEFIELTLFPKSVERLVISPSAIALLIQFVPLYFKYCPELSDETEMVPL